MFLSNCIFKNYIFINYILKLLFFKLYPLKLLNQMDRVTDITKYHIIIK
jgi:hypothetical protein